MDTTFTIRPSGPFSWGTATDMARHFPPVARHWRDSAPNEATPVRLAFPLDGDFAPVAVALWWETDALHGEVAGTDDVAAVRDQVARMFSLDHDGAGYPAVGVRDPQVGRLMQLLPGLRPVCFSSPYETAAWAIISQRIGTAQAARIQDGLVEQGGTRISVAGGEGRSFPTPQALLGVERIDGLAAVKLDRLHGVARAALDGRLDAGTLRQMGPADAQAELRRIPGIGPFWASGIYLRGCGIVDEFPDEPLSIAALGQLHGLGDQPDPVAVAAITDRYEPYRMWVGVLLRVAAARGMIPGVAGREGSIRRAAR